MIDTKRKTVWKNKNKMKKIIIYTNELEFIH